MILHNDMFGVATEQACMTLLEFRVPEISWALATEVFFYVLCDQENNHIYDPDIGRMIRPHHEGSRSGKLMVQCASETWPE